MDPVVITVAAVGAELTLEQQPNLSVRPEQLAADAHACQAAGASIYHLHVRDAEGQPTMDVATFEAARRAIADASELIVQFTTGGAVTDQADARVAPLELRPEMATLTTGSVNFGNEVFLNPDDLVDRLYLRMKELGIAPEFEIFDSGMLAGAERVMAEHGPPSHVHYDFVIGVPGGIQAWPDTIDFLSSKVPADATWTATGIGRAHLTVTEQALLAGGHVRTGLEDVRYFAPKEPATSNAQLIERVAEMARATGREVATPDQARELLGL